MNLSNNFSHNVSSLRKICRCTLSEFADETGISRSHLQNILKCACNPTLDTVEQVSKGLQTDPLALLAPPANETPAAALSPQLLSNMQELKLHLQAALCILEAMLPEESEPPDGK